MRRLSAQMLLSAVVLACGGGGDSPTPPPPVGGFTFSAAVSSASLTVGGSTVVGFALVRTGSFTGPVSLTVAGLPAGVTGTFAPSTIDAASNTSFLTLNAALTAAASGATLVVTATGAGVAPQTATVALVVTQSAIAISATPTALSVPTGQTGSVTISIGRSTGYSGAVSFALVSPPAGITAAFNASPTTTATSVMSVIVANTAVPGTYPLTVRGTAPGAQDRTLTVTLTVTPAGASGLVASVDPAEFELPALSGWSMNGVVRVQRPAGYTGAVTVTVQGLNTNSIVVATPGALTSGINATNVVALSSATTPIGVYDGFVRVSAPGFADATVPLRLRVSASSTGSIAWRFCQGTLTPWFFAVRDGSGPWRHIVPSGGPVSTGASAPTFSFDLAQSTGAVAIIRPGERTGSGGGALLGGYHWEVYYGTRDEIVQWAADECVRNREAAARSAGTTVTGYQLQDALLPTVSRAALTTIGSTNVATAQLNMANIAPGPFDLMITRSSFGGGVAAPVVTHSVILRRGEDPASGGAIPALNFATQGVAPATGQLTFGNTGGDPFNVVSAFQTINGLHAPFSATVGNISTTRTWYGIPSSLRIATDLHQLTATTSVSGSRRAIIHFADAVGDRILAFGPALPSPTLAATGSTPWFLRATGALGSEYAARVSLYLREQVDDPRSMVMVVTRGWLGAGTSYDVTLPDLSAATGFVSFLNMRPGNTVRWTVTGGEGDPGGAAEFSCVFTGVCPVRRVNGATYLSAQASGTTVIP